MTLPATSLPSLPKLNRSVSKNQHDGRTPALRKCGNMGTVFHELPWTIRHYCTLQMQGVHHAMWGNVRYLTLGTPGTSDSVTCDREQVRSDLMLVLLGRLQRQRWLATPSFDISTSESQDVGCRGERSAAAAMLVSLPGFVYSILDFASGNCRVIIDPRHSLSPHGETGKEPA